MYLYDMTLQADANRLIQEAGDQGRVAAHQLPLSERSDVIYAHARTLCEKQLSETPQLTNDPAAFTSHYVESYVDAYFQELVAFLRSAHTQTFVEPGNTIS